MDLLELRTLGTGTGPLKVQLGYLRSVSLASKGYLPRPEGLSESWWDFAVLLEFFEPTEAMELRTECVLLNGDVEARLLCRSLQQLQRFGVPFEPKEELPEWVAARAKAAYASLTSEDVAFALKKWREGSMVVRPKTTPMELGTCTGLSLASLWSDATQALWEAMNSPAVLGFKPDPSLAAGWDAPMQGDNQDRLEAEAQLTEKWRKILGGRQPCELNRQQMRALFALADRIPWQYRLVLWAHWLKVAEEDSQPLEGEAGAPETCRKQIEKDIPRTRPADLDEKQRAALGRVLLKFSVLRPKVGYCQGLNFIVAVELLAGYYEESMRGLLRDIAVLDALLLLLLPKIHARFAEVDLPLLWIAAEPLLTLFSRELKTIESICRLWDFFLIEGPCAPFAVFLAYAELAQERNLLTGAAAEDTLGAFRLLLGDPGAIAGSVLRRAALFLAPRPFGGGLNDTLLARLRQEADHSHTTAG